MNLTEIDQALMWLKSFEMQTRVETKRNIDATTGTSGPPAFAVVAKDFQEIDFFHVPMQPRGVDEAQ